jgi:hypothetical protein
MKMKMTMTELLADLGKKMLSPQADMILTTCCRPKAANVMMSVPAHRFPAARKARNSS